MTTQSARDDVATDKAKIEQGFKELLEGTEALLRSTAAYTGEEIGSARGRLRARLDDARQAARALEHRAKDRYRHATVETDSYVRANAWKTIRTAMLVGVLVGILATPRR